MGAVTQTAVNWVTVPVAYALHKAEQLLPSVGVVMEIFISMGQGAFSGPNLISGEEGESLQMFSGAISGLRGFQR